MHFRVISLNISNLKEDEFLIWKALCRKDVSGKSQSNERNVMFLLNLEYYFNIYDLNADGYIGRNKDITRREENDLTFHEP